MKKVSSKFYPLFLFSFFIVAFLGCRTEMFPVSGTSTRAIHNKLESTLAFCGGDPTVLDHWVREFRHSDANLVLAGFQTRWSPGGTCDRLHQFVGQGLFRFDLTDIARRISFASYRSASIVITNYAPENGEVRIIQDDIWGSGNEFGGAGSIIRKAYYELKQVIEPWDPAVETWASEPVRTARLANNDTNNWITVPFQEGNPYIQGSNGELSAVVNVTEVVRNILIAGGNYGRNNIYGFALEPVGPALLFKRANRSVGTFNVELRITYER